MQAIDPNARVSNNSKGIPYDSISTTARRALVKLVFEQNMSVR
jgi:hypothetical protein